MRACARAGSDACDAVASRLGRERFSAAAAVDLMMQLLSAMDALHERHLLLHDLRPQNVFLAQRRGCRPVVKILDVGLARLIPLERVRAEWDVLRAVTSTADVTGLLAIPYYLSPERARGANGIEPSSDIFAAGIILYEALTGQKPFVSTSWNGLIQQITNAQPAPLSVLRPDLPEELGSLIMRALAAKPQVRPASAREMQDELRGVFDGSRRGSASTRAVPVAMPVSEVDSVAHTPLRVERRPPTGPSTDEPAASRSIDELYEEETRTDRSRFDATMAAEASAVDEASADHPVRTVRPPRLGDAESVDVDVDVDMNEPAATSRGSDLESTLDIPRAWKAPATEDDETATMQLTPELRARIELMTKHGPQGAVEDSSRPPPTRRLKPPGGR